MAKNLLSINDLTKDEILELINFSNSFIDDEGNFRKENLFPDKIVANVFFEPSTRTKMSFAVAAGNLGCNVLDFNIDSSSVQKGESIFETIDALNLMGVDLCVLRHPDSVIRELAEHMPDMVFVNAGEGSISHPTQALLDALTILKRKKQISGLKVAICGDILHSRVARSNIHLLNTLGAEVRVIAPATLIPKGIESLGVRVFYDMKNGLKDVDIIIMLRLQLERMSGSFVPSIREYFRFYGLDREKLNFAKHDALILHPGPMNRGGEIDSELADDIDRSAIFEQVQMGVAVRMACLKAIIDNKIIICLENKR